MSPFVFRDHNNPIGPTDRKLESQRIPKEASPK